MKRKFVEVIEQLKQTQQGKLWHPEGDVYTHTVFVWYGTSQSAIESELLQYVALFHDLGKIDTTESKILENGTEKITSYGHEFKSLDYIDEFVHLIPEHIDVNRVKKLVKNHMKIKFLDKMRTHKQKEFISYMGDDLELLFIFNQADSAKTFWETTTQLEKEYALIRFSDWLHSKILNRDI